KVGWRFGLVAVESRELQSEWAVAERPDGDRPFENLREMVVDRILDEWPHHRIVRAKRHETLSRTRRHVSAWPDRALPGCDKLVEIRMRMPPVHVSLSRNPRVQLAALQRETLQI